uniref:phospholipase B1, membrane-associated n=1 Tax=Pristiophorus japonicus TaxID=55135 RepID=UPI00398EC5B8
MTSLYIRKCWSHVDLDHQSLDEPEEEEPGPQSFTANAIAYFIPPKQQLTDIQPGPQVCTFQQEPLDSDEFQDTCLMFPLPNARAPGPIVEGGDNAIHLAEAVSGSIADLRRLAEPCKFGNVLEDMLQDFFVIGSNHDVIFRKLLVEEKLDLRKTIATAQSLEWDLNSQLLDSEAQVLPTAFLWPQRRLQDGFAEKPAERTHIGEKENDTNLPGDRKSVVGLWVGCSEDTFSSSPSDSVHTLRPSEIKVIAMMGDSLTVESTQHNGPSTSTGKDPNTWMQGSLPDILKTFNPDLIGYSSSNRNHDNASLDQSVLRVKAEGLPGQAQKLVTSLKNNMHINFQKDWKLITVYVGIADMCAYCTNEEYYSPEKVAFRIKEALDILHREVPRAFVNLVEMQNIDNLHQFYDRGLSTPELRGWCDCLVKRHDSAKLSAHIISWDFRNVLQELVYSGIYDKRDDFTVVLQPFLRNMEIPLTADGKPDLSYFSQDGFHFSDRSRALLASGLWNNMLEPSGEKNEVLECSATNPRLHCPTQKRPFLFTYRNSDYAKSLDAEMGMASQQDSGSEVICMERDPSNAVPVSVHQLRPADIKVIAALGDSLTAGNGAGSKPNDILDIITQYRGLAWSIGGNENITTVTTLTNILREFNPSLVGYSTGIGRQDTPQSFLNQAVAGAEAPELMIQVRKLVKLLKNDSRINFQEDWKMITLFIGANDLCKFCEDPNKYSPDNFMNSIQEVLDILHSEVPRVFVNLVTVLNIIPLRELFTEPRVKCPRFLLKLLCECVINPLDNSPQLEELQVLNRKYQERTHLLVGSGRYDTREDFTVVIQPFVEDIEIPRTKDGLPDKSYFAPDCFHFSVKGHSQVARGLWKNLLEPLGGKTFNQTFDDPINISCPSKDQPYLRTYKNSNFTYPNNSGQLTSVAPGSIETTTVPSHKVFGSELLCKDRAPSDVIPNSVHSLRPADVKVIGAVGDSLTAGNGIGSKPNDVLDVLTQYRGLSFSIGGDESLRSTTTLPNIFRQFNPSLTGFSTGKGNSENPNTFLNQAVPGALARDLPGQVRRLVDIMKNNSKIDFQNDWKMINLFIGGNDVCNYCTDSAYYSAINFAKQIEEALDILHKVVPRAFVNLIEVLQLIPLRRLHQDTQLSCPRALVRMLCYCVVKPKENSSELQIMTEANTAYQRSTQQLVESGRYDTRKDFTVVLQPFLRRIEIPILENGHPDASFFAPDCFHLSRKFHTQMSRALWNNILQPVGEKSDFQDVTANISLSCPSQAQPFLRTFKNSNYTYQGLDPTTKPPENWGSDLSCSENLPSKTVPTSVHRLRPADIKVVAAMGDSLTVAFGARAKNLFELRIQYQGVAWSIGGDKLLEIVTTFPNVLKKFNPNIYGFATGTGKWKSRFNVAVAGAKANDMPKQAHTLIQLMKNSSEINFEQDWKVITLLIGANDLCEYCMNKETYSANNYMNHIQEALDILHKQIPRVFINVMQIPELNGLRRIKKNSIGCALLQKTMCACFLNPRENSPELHEIMRVNRDYQTKLNTLIYSGKYDTSEDFTVVLQPYFSNTIVSLNSIGQPDLSFFSVDCFHLSERGHAEMAIGLWNNMLEPIGYKQNYNNFTHDRTKLKCPSSEAPYVFTRRNSAVQPEDTSRNPTPTTVTTTAHAVPVAEQKVWAAVLITIAGMIVGAALVLAIAKLTSRKYRKQHEKPLELNGSKL